MKTSKDFSAISIRYIYTVQILLLTNSLFAQELQPIVFSYADKTYRISPAAMSALRRAAQLADTAGISFDVTSKTSLSPDSDERTILLQYPEPSRRGLRMVCARIQTHSESNKDTESHIVLRAGRMMFLGIRPPAGGYFLNVTLSRTHDQWSIINASVVMSSSAEFFFYGLLDPDRQTITDFILPEFSKILMISDYRLQAVSQTFFEARNDYPPQKERALQEQSDLLAHFLSNSMNLTAGSVRPVLVSGKLHFEAKLLDTWITLPASVFLNRTKDLFTQQSIRAVLGSGAFAMPDTSLVRAIEALDPQKFAALAVRRDWHVVSTTRSCMPTQYFTRLSAAAARAEGKSRLIEMHLHPSIHPMMFTARVGTADACAVYRRFVYESALNLGGLNFIPSEADLHQTPEVNYETIRGILSFDRSQGSYRLFFFSPTDRMMNLSRECSRALELYDWKSFKETARRMRREGVEIPLGGLTSAAKQSSAAQEAGGLRFKEAAKRYARLHQFLILSGMTFSKLRDYVQPLGLRMYEDETGNIGVCGADDSGDSIVFPEGTTIADALLRCVFLHTENDPRALVPIAVCIDSFTRQFQFLAMRFESPEICDFFIYLMNETANAYQTLQMKGLTIDYKHELFLKDLEDIYGQDILEDLIRAVHTFSNKRLDTLLKDIFDTAMKGLARAGSGKPEQDWE